MEKLKGLFLKYKEQILYVFFGGLTTMINWGAYALCYNVLGVSNVPSVIIAWILGVAFAFVTNKIWVFESRSFDTKTVLRELWTFVAARLATGLLDLGIMYLAVDVLGGNGNVWKLISNVVVIILNYVFSKLIVFRKRDGGDNKDAA
ncbi:MAG: GtrA family protein [Clostridia bacterium]|nr:GtrA family protein [Clostridia bacterium]MBR7041757.1 GtrA family protein [Clostridia bacterium]MCR4577473.1 GtrA family protein [Clostridiales bacterium]